MRSIFKVQPKIKGSQQYCQQTARYVAPAFYLSARWLDSRQQRAVFALAAFVAQVQDWQQASQIEALRLARQILNRRRYPAEPMWQELAWAVREFDLPVTYLNQIIAAAESDREFRQPRNFQELESYCLRSAGVLGLLAAHILKLKNQRQVKAAERLGIAIKLTQVLRRLDRDLSDGRLYLPASLLREVQLAGGDISLPLSPMAKVVMARLASQAATYFNQAERELINLPPAEHKAAMLVVELYRKALERLTRQDFEVFGVHTSPPTWQQFILLAKVQFGRDLLH